MNKDLSQLVSFLEKLILFLILICTIIAIVFEVLEMVELKHVELADLLLLFIYVEVIGMVRVYYVSNRVRMTYPLFIAITALSRLIILQRKDLNPEILLYEAGAIVLIAIAAVILRLRYLKPLKPTEDVDEFTNKKSKK
ncbi:MAG: phosphate starvation-inducible protein PhoH [Pelagibacteraceae bacterium]|nr:phosphate starvation-inducible protein PhoH [Pelagibacteraceae bacterium]|tara:strand:- start:2064 stop:2480 length:417 start_codon:yes stop_codon:yes gene_type:complete